MLNKLAKKKQMGNNDKGENTPTEHTHTIKVSLKAITPSHTRTSFKFYWITVSLLTPFIV